MKKIFYLFLMVMVISVFQIIDCQEKNYKILDEMVPMRDGVKLSTKIFLPDKEDKYPVILIRTPYEIEQKMDDCEFYVKRDYAAVLQANRGTPPSEGIFQPAVQEINDGDDTVKWILKQTWSNGNIGLIDSSYSALTGMWLAAQHDSIKAIVHIAGGHSLYDLLFDNGVFKIYNIFYWMLRGLAKEELNSAFNLLPLSKVIETYPQRADILEMIKSNLLRTEFYDLYNASEINPKLHLPVYFISGWYDMMTPGTLKTYSFIKENNLSFYGQENIILKLGPWIHDQVWNGFTKAGDLDFGKEAYSNADMILQETLPFFEKWLKGKDSKGLKKIPKVSVFFLEENKWGQFTDWPPREAVETKFFLASSGKANSLDGDGILSTIPPEKSAYDSFIYDPAHPVPMGGGAVFHWDRSKVGPFDQREIEKRKDVLVYTSPPCKKIRRFAGPVTAKLYVSTDGKDTDFTAKLVLVRPDGYAYILTDGIIRLSLRVTDEKIALVESDKIYESYISLGDIAFTLFEGYKIRLEISSSNFPKYSRNLNTGMSEWESSSYIIANQKVHHGKLLPSTLILKEIK